VLYNLYTYNTLSQDLTSDQETLPRNRKNPFMGTKGKKPSGEQQRLQKTTVNLCNGTSQDVRYSNEPACETREEKPTLNGFYESHVFWSRQQENKWWYFLFDTEARWRWEMWEVRHVNWRPPMWSPPRVFLCVKPSWRHKSQNGCDNASTVCARCFIATIFFLLLHVFLSELPLESNLLFLLYFPAIMVVVFIPRLSHPDRYLSRRSLLSRRLRPTRGRVSVPLCCLALQLMITCLKMPHVPCWRLSHAIAQRFLMSRGTKWFRHLIRFLSTLFSPAVCLGAHAP